MNEYSDVKTSLSDFQDRLNSLSPQAFENLVIDILQSINQFSEIIAHAIVGNREVDVIATAGIDSLPISSPKWVFEIKRRRIVAVDVIDMIVGRKFDIQEYIPYHHFVLVVSGNLTSLARERAQHKGIEVWDAPKLASLITPQIAQSYFGDSNIIPNNIAPRETKADSFIKSLHLIKSGRTEWSSYQQLCSEILEYLFCPPLEPPRYEFSDADSRNRRDMIFENPAVEGFWSYLRNTYSAHYIVADAKNYGTPLKKQPVLDIAHYLKPYGCGLFGLLLSRKGGGGAAQHALREQWIGGQKMIIILSDSDLVEMIKIKVAGGKPEEIIRKAIAEFRMSL